MKTNKKRFPLTTFIKNVQSTINKVGNSALKNIECILIGLGITARIIEMILADSDMPPSFYTDTALNMLVMWKWIKNKQQNTKSLGADICLRPKYLLKKIQMWILVFQPQR